MLPRHAPVGLPLSVERASDYGTADVIYAMLAAGAATFVPAALVEAFCNDTPSSLATLPFRSRSLLAGAYISKTKS